MTCCDSDFLGWAGHLGYMELGGDPRLDMRLALPKSSALLQGFLC